MSIAESGLKVQYISMEGCQTHFMKRNKLIYFGANKTHAQLAACECATEAFHLCNQNNYCTVHI